MPLSCQGLCEAEITMPAEKLVGARQVSDARRGDNAGADHLHSRRFQSRRQDRADPGARLARVLSDDRRAPLRRVRASRCPRARPMAYTVRRSSGYSPATPRIPSVPNSCRMFGTGIAALKAGLLLWKACLSSPSREWRRFLHPHQRIGHVGMGGEGRLAHHAGRIHRIGNGILDRIHSASPGRRW